MHEADSWREEKRSAYLYRVVAKTESGAAAFSFVSFATGAVVPLVPFMLLAGSAALAASVGLTAVALFGVGAVLSLYTGRNAAAGGVRMLAIGAAAGAVTYCIGKVLGVTLG